jgi:hypothetical protein
MNTRFGCRYQLVHEIGAGGMGRVFQALGTETGQTVAAKLLVAGKVTDFGIARVLLCGLTLPTKARW